MAATTPAADEIAVFRNARFGHLGIQMSAKRAFHAGPVLGRI